MDFDSIRLMIVIDKILTMIIWFGVGWGGVYTLFGAWLKVWAVHVRGGVPLTTPRRVAPVLLSHFLCSILFVNPWALFLILMYADFSWSAIGVGGVCLWVFPMALEALLLRAVPHVRWFRWLRWNPPLRRLVPVSLAVWLLACAGGYCAVVVGPYLRTAFPLRPAGYAWKLNIRAKPLADYSLPAELDRMVIDDDFVFVRVDSRRHQWKAIHKDRRRPIDVGADVLGYVHAEDSAGAWEISKTPVGLACGRFASGQRQALPLVVTDEAIFVPQESAHVILGTEPSVARLFAFHPASGEVLWDIREPPEQRARIGSLAVNRGVVVAGLWGSKIWAVSAIDGHTLWRFEEQGCGSPMYVVTTDDVVFGFSRLDKAYAFEAATGRLKWSNKLNWKPQLRAYAGSRVVFADNEAAGCLDGATGKLLWKSSPAEGTRFVGSSAELHYFSTAERGISGIDMQTGQTVFRAKFPAGRGVEYVGASVWDCVASIYAGPVADSDGAIYVLMSDGMFWKLDPGPARHGESGQ